MKQIRALCETATAIPHNYWPRVSRTRFLKSHARQAWCSNENIRVQRILHAEVNARFQRVSFETSRLCLKPNSPPGLGRSQPAVLFAVVLPCKALDTYMDAQISTVMFKSPFMHEAQLHRAKHMQEDPSP